MTTLDHTRPARSGFGAMLSDVFASVIAWNDQRVTRKALSQLSNRELDDIGLMRSDLDHM